MFLYGRHGRIVAKPDQRDALISVLGEATRAQDLPGCHLYILGAAQDDDVSILITEIWGNEEVHKASLALDHVRSAITKAMPLIESVSGEAFDVAHGIVEGA